MLGLLTAQHKFTFGKYSFENLCLPQLHMTFIRQKMSKTTYVKCLLCVSHIYFVDMWHIVGQIVWCH